MSGNWIRGKNLPINAVYCSISVAEMIAMKNDLTVEEVMTIKDVLPAAAIVQTRPEIPIEEAVALKANMTIGRRIIAILQTFLKFSFLSQRNLLR